MQHEVTTTQQLQGGEGEGCNSFTCEGVNGCDLVGVFLGEVFSKNEEQVLPSPLSLLLFLPVDAWVGLDESVPIREAAPPKPKGVVLLSWPEAAARVLTVKPSGL